MPCQSQLLRLRDSRQTLHHIFRHAVTYSPQQFRHEHSGTEEAARVEAARQRARLEALKRLDKHINPNDLSATLEAHRDANRASVIRKISSERSDPDVLRPSFLESQPHARAKRKLKQSANEVEEDEEDKSALGAFSKVVTNAAGNIDNAAAYQLRSLKRAAEATEREAQNEWRRTQNKEQYQRWVDFLTKYEDPLEPIPDYSDDDRRVFFTTLRRAFAIIREEQLKRSATWFVEDLAPKGFLSYYGLAQPIVSGLKGYPRSEPWNRRPKAGVKGDLMRYWLNVEIRAFANWMEMTPSENLARAKLSKILIDSIQQANPVLVAETYGSQATGLTMPNSDIDIRIKDSTFKHVPYEGEPNDKAAKAVWAAENMAQRKRLMNSHLRRIQSLLSSHDDFYQAHINETAYFPLVTAVHIPTGLKVQIVSTKWDHGARAATEKYLAEFPNLKMVFLLLKATLNLRNLSDPWFGGVGSYTLFMMCVAALKHGNKGLASKMESPALCLLHTLDFWGKFDTHREGLSVEPFAKFRKVRRQGWNEIEARKKDPVCTILFTSFVPGLSLTRCN